MPPCLPAFLLPTPLSDGCTLRKNTFNEKVRNGMHALPLTNVPVPVPASSSSCRYMRFIGEMHKHNLASAGVVAVCMNGLLA